MIGDELLLAQCAEILLSRGHSVEAVVTVNTNVRDWATENGIPIVEPNSNLADRLSSFRYDWLFSIANLRVVPEPVWRSARCGAVNFHDGPLPELAGVNTPSWAILNGAVSHGISWHAITAGIDEGDVYVSQRFDVGPDETAFTLNMKCFEAGIETFNVLLADIERGALSPRRQNIADRTYFGRHERPTPVLLLDRRAEELSRLVRALDFGPGYANRLVLPKLRAGADLFTVTRLRVLDACAEEPGTVISVGPDETVIATTDMAIGVKGSLRKGDSVISLSSVVVPGTKLAIPDRAQVAELAAAIATVVPQEAFFLRALETCLDVALSDVANFDPTITPQVHAIPLPLPKGMGTSARAALLGALLIRLTGQRKFDLAYSSNEILNLCARYPGYFANSVPLRVEGCGSITVAGFKAAVQSALEMVRGRTTYLQDVVERYPHLREPQLSVGVVECDFIGSNIPIENCAIVFQLGPEDSQLSYDATRVSTERAQSLARHLEAVAAHFVDVSRPLDELPLLSPAERQQILYDWNRTERNYDRAVCVHELIERQVNLTPEATALCFGNQSLTYREMDERANRIAHALIARGVGPDVLVGLHLRRAPDLVVGALAIQKAGGAYVPLDPDFPEDRLAFMVKDSGARMVLTERYLADFAAHAGVETLYVEDLLAQEYRISRLSATAVPENLAYVIYTSGSTGLPKGVMIEHRNVVNFFAGMDDRIARGDGGQDVWLAVTSLSFDISVLELFWTLARGFKVVIHLSAARRGMAARSPGATSGRPMDFGLFYWGNDAGVGPAKYRLLLEGAKFADRNGFQSVWTPERHFHAFGGPYPNPSVTGAAVAAVTRNLSIRAGSCVLPLHHPLRVAEEWAVIDNISNGRVALAFASGWMPEDFVLRPENAPPHNKTSMIRDIETVRRLWRGESINFDFGTGHVGVVTQPRPIQRELPVWLTTAGNPETYRDAARLGANVLTHLLGQSIDELAEKIRIYRETLAEVGRNPADHTVTVMLHTLLGDDREEVRHLARAPMKDYLRSAAALIKQYAWAFPAFKKPRGVSQPMDVDLQALAPEEMDAILEFAFLRYFEDSGLFGTVQDASERIDQMAAIGVDDIACLIDFGLPSEIVLARLEPLAQLVSAVRASRHEEAEIDTPFSVQIERHGVTHLQCTPSMMRMFMITPEDRKALGGINHLFIGGEALPGALLAEVATVTAANVENMYGPTETTIWSSTGTAAQTDSVVPLGRPIANTQLYVLDEARNPVPTGESGELYIGGDGVTRGYLNRAQLTAERFLPNPFAPGRIYRTGDIVRFDADGHLHFLGRADHQVKVRGYRIEFGEIEATITAFPGVLETVVMSREDKAGDVRIVAYLRTASSTVDDEALRRHLGTALPDYMIPSHFIALSEFPLTPNAKVDRKQLPKPEDARDVLSSETYTPPGDALQHTIAETFRRALGLERVGIFDSFFGLGGHSLLAVQVHRELKANIAPELTIVDIFRFPTVSALAAHLSDRGKVSEELGKVADRAALRRNALTQRRADQQRIRGTV
jgi:natural product biosynthesis luciferase-like monooxygenase protein